MNYNNSIKDKQVIESLRLQLENAILKKDQLKPIKKYKGTGNNFKYTKNHFQQIFSEMMQGAALHEMIYNDKGKAIDYRTLDVNRAYEKIMGIRREEVVGKYASSFIPESELRKWLSIFSPVAEGGGRRYYKQYSQLNDKYFEGVVFSPQPGQFWVTFSDFTNRKFAEKTLQKSEEKWRKLVATIPSFVALHDLEGRYLFLNHYAEGYCEKDIIGKSLFDFISESSRDEYQRNFRNCIRTKQTQHFVYKGFGNNKAVRIYESYIVPILEKDQVVNVMDIATDITEQKKMEEKLLKSKEMLERLNQHLNDIREDERAAISREIHDELGQSMTALKLDLSQMYRYVSRNKEASEKLEKMIGLISDTIKNVQRISSELRPGILDDLGLVSAVEWYCGEFEKRTGIHCEFKFDDPVYRDARINLVLFRVLQETLTNVIRHARATSVRITLYKTTKGNIMIVQDDGIGIQEEKIESHKSLGLISMRERVRQFGGKIIISSGKGNGTRLSVFIPEKKKALQ